MIIDSELELGDGQAVTVTAATTDYLDRGAVGDLGVTEGLHAAFTVTEAFTAVGAGTLTIALEKDDSETFDDPDVVSQTEAIAKGTLVVGYQRFIPIPPGTDLQYLRGKYTVATGPFTAGKISCQIVKGIQKNVALADGLAAQVTV